MSENIKHENQNNPPISDHQECFITLELPNKQDDDNLLNSWVDLLVDSIFSVFGSDLIVANWLVENDHIVIKSIENNDREIARSLAWQFLENLEDKGEISSIHQFDAIFNGVKIEISKNSNNIDNNFVNIHATLSLANKKLGYIGIFAPPENGKCKVSHLSLLQSPVEITSGLKFLWNLITRERDRLDAILNGMMDGVLLLNEGGDILFANCKAREFLGLDNHSCRKLQHLKQARHIDISSFLEEAIHNQYNSLNKIKKVDVLNKILGINIQKLSDQDNPLLGWMAILRDITSDWEMDKLQKEFIAKISHELHSPITIISEGIALVLEEKAGKINNDQKRCLEYARENMGRMQRLIDNLMRITRLEIKETELERRKTIHLRQLVDRLLQSYQLRFQEKNIRPKIAFSESEIKLQMDRDKVTQVFVNLIDNALKYTEPGGKIEIGAKKETENVTCWVKDTGIGIPKNQQKRIFQKFYRIEEDRNQNLRGNGLGLNIVQEIITNYGSYIWVESEEGKGSRFIFKLPLKGNEKKVQS